MENQPANISQENQQFERLETEDQRLERLEKTEADIARIFDLGRELSAMEFDSQEESIEFAKVFAGEVADIRGSNPDLLQTQFLLEGGGVLIPNFQSREYENNPNAIVVETKNGVCVADGSSDITGQWTGEVHMMGGVSHNDTYALTSQLQFKSENINFTYEMGSTDMMAPKLYVSVSPEVRVTIDDSSRLTIPELDTLRNRRQSLAEARKKSTDPELMRAVHDLNEALHRANNEKFIDLKKLDLLKKIGRKSLEGAREVEHFTDALATVIGRDRPLIVGGEIYTSENSKAQGLVMGNAIDVLATNPVNEKLGASLIVSANVNDEEKILYMPLKDIETFRF